jgi:hypothetical protein
LSKAHKKRLVLVQRVPRDVHSLRPLRPPRHQQQQQQQQVAQQPVHDGERRRAESSRPAPAASPRLGAAQQLSQEELQLHVCCGLWPV